MTAPPRARARQPIPGLPTIPPKSRENDERDQIQFLVWRLELFLRDAGAKKRAKAFRSTCDKAWASGAPYVRMVEIIEEQMTGFLAAQANTIQTIFNEK